MEHLLVDASLFLPILNGCLVQLTGMPLYSLPPLPTAKSPTKRRPPPGGDTVTGPRKRRRKTTEGSNAVIGPSLVGRVVNGNERHKKTGANHVVIPRFGMLYGRVLHGKNGKIQLGLSPFRKPQVLPVNQC